MDQPVDYKPKGCQLPDNPWLSFLSKIPRLLMLHGCGVGNYLHQLHHAAVFVAQDVAMQNVHACEIYESSQHLKVAARWDREIIPPDPGTRQLNRNPAVLFRIHDLDNLKRIDVDMERMGRTAIVIHGPLFSRAE